MLNRAAWLISLLLHAAVALAFFGLPTGEESLESGIGGDQFVVEAGVAIEGVEVGGRDRVTVEAVETPPAEASEARPPIEEVKTVEKSAEEPPLEAINAAELPEDAEVVGSTEGPERETPEPKKPEVAEVEPPQPPQTATLESPDSAPVREERSSGPEQSGGQATLLSAYRGKLSGHLRRAKVSPRSRLTGTVVVRFTVGASGELISREVAKSSGHRVLDEAAVASLDRAAPFPPFPDGMSREPMVQTVPFRFVTR